MSSQKNSLDRRQFIEKSIGISSAGTLAALSLEERTLLAGPREDSQPTNGPRTNALDTGKIGKLNVSRLICGGNLFSGFAHSRDLVYVSALMKQYFTPEKVMDTLQICEEQGVNTAILRCDEHITGILDRYRKERGGKIQWIAQTYPKVDNVTENIQLAIDNGAVGAFMQGGIGDRLVADERMDVMGEIISFIQQNGLVAGVGSHSLGVTQAVEQAGLAPDFYFKTLNGVSYNSEDPAEIAAFMKTVKRPWIAFKVLGAGMLKPRDGFQMALKMGADFLNVGMFDFQVKEDVRLMDGLLAANLPRERPWHS